MHENLEGPRILGQLDLEKESTEQLDYKEIFEKVVAGSVTKGGISAVLPTEWIEFAVQIYLKDQHKYAQFPFTDRRYLKEVIDSPAKSKLFCYGRQAEKCAVYCTKVSRANGSIAALAEVSVGDEVLTMRDDFRVVAGKVTKKYRNGTQRFIRITTRLGHRKEVTRSHPIRTLYGMTPAGELERGSRIAAITRGGEFGDHEEDDDFVKFVGYMIGDGCVAKKNFSYTQLPGETLAEFFECAQRLGVVPRWHEKIGTEALCVRLSQKDGPVLRRFKEDSLWGITSEAKHVPDWVYDLNRRQTALFLNRLWSTDGFVWKRSDAQYEISYCSVSERLIDEVQALLWKFGIPTRRVPYKPKGGQLSWKLYIQTQQGFRTFLEEIGALGKSEDTPIPAADTNNNRYTIPKEINSYLKQQIQQYRRDGEAVSTGGGLGRVKLKYPPTPGKLARYAAYIDKHGGDAQFLWDLIEGDIVWDTVESIEDIGEDDAYDIEVEDTHNYVANGIVTHNSTALGNICLTFCCLVPSVHVLYVSPTAPQTKIFSRDRLAEPVEISPRLKQFTSKHLPWNIFEKTFINQAKIILRYCYYSADRIRGIAADILMVDEVQDILTENIPIMEETLSHSALRYKYYAGTPKAAEGSLGFYWDRSTKAEWLVPCYRHTPRYWNRLGERNIGLKGLVCSKCGKRINPYDDDAQWVKFNEGEYEFEGYRVPQIMVPIHQGEEEWKALLAKREKYSPSQFYNEVLALFSAGGDKPITEEELRKCCNSTVRLEDTKQLEQRLRLARSYEIYAGIDWGGGSRSYTVLCLASYFGGDKLKFFYFKRFIGQEADPVYQIDVILKILTEYKVNICGVDFGYGHVQNTKIAQELVNECAVAKCYYSSNPKQQISFSPGVDRFTLHRTAMMSNLFNIIKSQMIELPAWEDFKTYGRDVLNIVSEYNESLRMIQYIHPPSKPDDVFHAILYCMVASFISQPREELLGMPVIPQSSD